MSMNSAIIRNSFFHEDLKITYILNCQLCRKFHYYVTYLKPYDILQQNQDIYPILCISVGKFDFSLSF